MFCVTLTSIGLFLLQELFHHLRSDEAKEDNKKNAKKKKT
jgi:hypothetical protein